LLVNWAILYQSANVAVLLGPVVPSTG